MFRKTTIAAAFLVAGLAAGSTQAAPVGITIGQPGFEGAPNRGAVSLAPWQRSSNGSNSVGVESYSSLGTRLDAVPGGGTYLHYNNGSAESIYQVLAETLAADTTYTLSIQAVDRTDLIFKTSSLRLGYVPGVDDGTTGDNITNDFFGEFLLSPTSVVNPTPVNGAAADDGWEDWTYTFTTGAAPAGEGSPLRIEIAGSGVQSLFDNVALTKEATVIPEPASLAMGLAGLTLIAARRRR